MFALCDSQNCHTHTRMLPRSFSHFHPLRSLSRGQQHPAVLSRSIGHVIMVLVEFQPRPSTTSQDYHCTLMTTRTLYMRTHYNFFFFVWKEHFRTLYIPLRVILTVHIHRSAQIFSHLCANTSRGVHQQSLLQIHRDTWTHFLHFFFFLVSAYNALKIYGNFSQCNTCKHIVDIDFGRKCAKRLWKKLTKKLSLSICTSFWLFNMKFI